MFLFLQRAPVFIVLWCSSYISVNLCQRTSSHVSKIPVSADGSYKLFVYGKPWLESAATFVTINGRVRSSKDGSLKLQNSRVELGEDVLGAWSSNVLHWRAGRESWMTSLTAYQDHEFFVFDQHFVNATTGTSNGNAESVSSSFPSFKMDKNSSLGLLGFGGIMSGDTALVIGRWGKTVSMASGLNSGPLVLFDRHDNVVILSSFSSFMSASLAFDIVEMEANWGLMGTMDPIPDAFHLKFCVFYSGKGIQKAIEGWGKLLRRRYGKTHDLTRADFSNNYLGYWTDNGAFYYYLTEKNKTYEDTLYDIKDYANSSQIPYRYVQYDSWWYPKGSAQGVLEWTSMQKVFPSGLRTVYDRTGWPVVAHNRWWSDKTPYAIKNGGRYHFVIEHEQHKSLPLDASFWIDLMRESRKWGLITYEQDWLNAEFNMMNITLRDVAAGSTWLKQMGIGASMADLTIQYCMAPSRHLLQSLEIPAVTQSRVSNDYHPGKDDWRIGMSSMFADAVGVAPFKDNFWTTRTQPGNPYGAEEPHSHLHAVVATLSTGPVGPSDSLGHSDVALIMRSCNAAGWLLQPSRPAFAIDGQIKRSAFGKSEDGPDGHVSSTYSTITGWVFGIVLAADLRAPFKLTPMQAGFESVDHARSQAHYVFEGKSAFVWNNYHPIAFANCTKTNFCLKYSSPRFQLGEYTVTIYGELDKWVPMSPDRVRSLTIAGTKVILELYGSPGEVVEFGFILNDRWMSLTCRLSQSGTAMMNLLDQTCQF